MRSTATPRRPACVSMRRAALSSEARHAAAPWARSMTLRHVRAHDAEARRVHGGRARAARAPQRHVAAEPALRPRARTEGVPQRLGDRRAILTAVEPRTGGSAKRHAAEPPTAEPPLEEPRKHPAHRHAVGGHEHARSPRGEGVRERAAKGHRPAPRGVGRGREKPFNALVERRIDVDGESAHRTRTTRPTRVFPPESILRK